MKEQIYIIKNDLNDFVYIGSTMISLKQRFKWHYNSIYDHKKKNLMHRNMLGNFKKFSIHLLCAYDVEDRPELFKLEKEWIKYHKENNYNLYNIKCN